MAFPAKTENPSAYYYPPSGNNALERRAMSGNTSADEAAIRGVMSAYEAALNALHTKAVMPLYADDGVFMPQKSQFSS
jgi:hypothetical protein